LAILTTSGACVEGPKHINGNAHRSYQVGYCCFLCLWDNHSWCYSLWKATFVHTKLMFLEWTVFRSSAYSTSKSW